MRHRLLRGELAQLVEEHVQLELAGEVAEAAVAERLPVRNNYSVFKLNIIKGILFLSCFQDFYN